jgi:GDP-4-dehydro-6-deoxy-D-mannose reductase
VRVWVTGASGFVGRHLLPRLIETGWEVSGTDRELDVADSERVEAKLAEWMPSAIVHLAAQSSVAASRDSPGLTHRVNYLGALSILRAALRCGSRPRVLLIGSGDQYGSAPLDSPPFTEASPFDPKSSYARSKADADLLGAHFAAAGLPVVRVRAFNHSGPGQSDVFVMSSFARQVAEIEARRRKPVLRVGNLDSVRDFLDVNDVVDAYLRLLEPSVEPDAYNVASGVGVRVGDLLEILISKLDARPTVEWDPQRHRPTNCAVGDPGRLRSATGWQVNAPIAGTLERLLDYWRRVVSES